MHYGSPPKAPKSTPKKIRCIRATLSVILFTVVGRSFFQRFWRYEIWNSLWRYWKSLYNLKLKFHLRVTWKCKKSYTFCYHSPTVIYANYNIKIRGGFAAAPWGALSVWLQNDLKTFSYWDISSETCGKAASKFLYSCGLQFHKKVTNQKSRQNKF